MLEYLLILPLREKIPKTKKKHKQTQHQESNPIRFLLQIQEKLSTGIFCLTDYSN